MRCGRLMHLTSERLALTSLVGMASNVTATRASSSRNIDFLAELTVFIVLLIMASSSSYPFVVHTTPPIDGLAGGSIDDVYHAALFQHTAPGRFALQTADWGENGGSIPYVTHLDHRIRPRHLKSIPAFRDPDESLGDEEKAEVLAWTAYIEQNLTDLVVSLPRMKSHPADRTDESRTTPSTLCRPITLTLLKPKQPHYPFLSPTTLLSVYERFINLDSST